MNIILLFACIGMITGCFVLLNISILDLAQNLFKLLIQKPESIKDSLNETNNRKKESYFRREVSEVKAILEITGRANQFPMLSAVAMLMFAFGGAFAIAIGNFFLVPVLAVGLMFTPFWYVKLTQTHFKRDISNELETALSIITTGYLRSENIVTAIEENVQYLNPPVLNVFQSFLNRIKLVDPDVVLGLIEMKKSIENPVFKEWVDALILCQNDRSLKSTLNAITSKLSDMRIVNSELEMLVNSPRQEFITMVALVLSNIPLLYFLNHDWYNSLMFTIVGQIVLAICATCIFISTAFVIKLTQPIEYKR